MLLASIAHSTVAPAEIIVVDDNSADSTAAVARDHGAIVIEAPPPPDGWLGKPWACHLGAQRAAAARLLFLDADVRLAPDAIGALLSQHGQQTSGLLSVQPCHRPVHAYEQLSAMFNIVGPMGSGAFAIRPPTRQRTAFGPCLLTSAVDYAASGGHSSVRGEIVEDIALATRFGDGRMPVRVLLGGASVSFRMYPDGLRSVVEGWTKNIAAGASRAHRPTAIAAAIWVAAISAVAVSTMLGLVGWMRHGEVPWLELAAWCLAVAQVHVLLQRVGRFHALTAFLYPVPLAFFIAVFLRSLSRLALRRPVRWRGREVPARATGPAAG